MNGHITDRGRVAAVIDGDNLARGGLVELKDVERVLHHVNEFTRGWRVTFAMQRKLAERYMTAYAGRGWRLRFASMAPDAADVELLDAAFDYVGHGASDIIVVSGDHAFTELAAHARLHVVAYSAQLSYRLRLAATTVTYLDDLLVPVAA